MGPKVNIVLLNIVVCIVATSFVHIAVGLEPFEEVIIHG